MLRAIIRALNSILFPYPIFSLNCAAAAERCGGRERERESESMDCHPNLPSEIPHLVGPAGESPFGDGSFSGSNTPFRILPNSIPDDWTPRDADTIRLRLQRQSSPKLRCWASANRPLVPEPLKVGEEHTSPLGSPSGHDHFLSSHQSSPRLLLQDSAGNLSKRSPALPLPDQQAQEAREQQRPSGARSIPSHWNNNGHVAVNDANAVGLRQ